MAQFNKLDLLLKEIEDPYVQENFYKLKLYIERLAANQAGVTNVTQTIVAGGGSGTSNTILNGSGPPAAGLGNNGDFYIDTTNYLIYGPKTSGAWGSGTSIIGPQGPPGVGGGGGSYLTTTKVAGETISALKLVYVGADGKLYVADPTTYTTAQVFGIALNAGILDDDIEVLTSGPLQDGSFAFTNNEPLFLGPTGGLTQTAPTTGYSVNLGNALDADEIFINLEQPIEL